MANVVFPECVFVFWAAAGMCGFVCVGVHVFWFVCVSV